LATPVTGLKLGAAFDYLDVHNTSGGDNAWAIAVMPPISHGEVEPPRPRRLHSGRVLLGNEDYKGKIFALTATVQYDLWKNVISRLEFRWDHDASDEYEYDGRPAAAVCSARMATTKTLYARGELHLQVLGKITYATPSGKTGRVFCWRSSTYRGFHWPDAVPANH